MASGYPLRPSDSPFARGLLGVARPRHGPLRDFVAGSMLQWKLSRGLAATVEMQKRSRLEFRLLSRIRRFASYTTSARAQLPANAPDTRCHCAAGLTTVFLQVMRRTRSAPGCPSTQPVAGAKSPLWATFGSQRMLDDRLGAGRAGFVVHTSRRRRVSQGPCSRSFVGGAIQPERACVASHATRQRVSLTPASRRAFCAEPSHRYRTVQ